MSDNLRGAILMTLAMAGFALEDMFIKLLAGAIPIGQILVMLGTCGAVVFAALAKRKGQALFSADMASRAMVIRNIGEVVGTVGFVLGFVLASLSTASAILQATPLIVTLGAALFLGAQVGWRRHPRSGYPRRARAHLRLSNVGLGVWPDGPYRCANDVGHG